jgi:hypothetical protein
MTKVIGSLWKPKLKKENSPALSGTLELVNGLSQQIAVFVNTKKTKPTQPDYNIVLSKPFEKGQEEQGKLPKKSDDL